MSDLRERVAQAIRDSAETSRKRNFFLDCADAAIALVRAEVLEEAARVADRYEIPMCETSASHIASAIRALKEKL